MNIEIISIGSLKEQYLKEAEREYLKRLTPYCNVFVTELKEARLPHGAGPAEEEKVRQSEGEALLAAVKKRESTYVIALDMRGSQMTSEKFADSIEEIKLSGISTITFIIGGSLGLSETVRRNANRIISFSQLTFPHQLMRIILAEQIYRANRILRGEPYHK